MFSCEYCETFMNTYFEEHLRTTAFCTAVALLPLDLTYFRLMFLSYTRFQGV